MRRIFFYILFFISGFHLFSQHTNYDSVLKTFKTPLEKYEYVHKELKRSGVLGASISLELSRKKLEYAMDLGDTVKVAGAYNDVGNQYLDLSDYSAALNYYLKASKFYGYKKDSVGIAMEYENISLIYSSKEDYHTAKKFMKMAVRLQEKYSRKENYYSTLGNLGDVYRNLKMIDSAFYYYNIVIRNTKDSSELAILYNNIGLYYLENNSLDSAIVFLKLSNYIDKRLGNKMNFAISEGNLADCYCKRGDIKKGLNEYRFALTLSRQLKNPELIMSSCGAMADVFAAQKQFDSAHHYLEIYTNINDSLHNTTAELQMADLRSGFDRENHEKELKIQELESEKKEQDSRNIINSFIVASLFLVTVIGFAIYRYKAKQRSYDELKLLNNEVTTQKTLVEEKQKEIVDSITY
ncbi:MAG: tetratricopeptide repeat protein, partial [Bacteroidia bacterium]